MVASRINTIVMPGYNDIYRLYRVFTGLVSKTNCPFKLLYASLTSKGNRLNTSLLEGVLQFHRN